MCHIGVEKDKVRALRHQHTPYDWKASDAVRAYATCRHISSVFELECQRGEFRNHVRQVIICPGSLTHKPFGFRRTRVFLRYRGLQVDSVIRRKSTVRLQGAYFSGRKHLLCMRGIMLLTRVAAKGRLWRLMEEPPKGASGMLKELIVYIPRHASSNRFL